MVTIDRMRIDVRTNADVARARAMAETLPGNLPSAIGRALAHHGSSYRRLLVPQIRVELRADLSSTSSDALARALAAACAQALDEEASTADALGGVGGAEACLASNAVWCTPEVEMAAWLTATLHGSTVDLWKRSLDREFAHTPVSHAFRSLLGRVDDPAAVVRALGSANFEALACSSSEADACAILMKLDSRLLPEGDMNAESSCYRKALIDYARAGRTESPAELIDATANGSSESNAGWDRSNFTGLWCLLRPLADLLEGFDEAEARHLATYVAVLLCGESALIDPAISLWQCEPANPTGAEILLSRRLATLAIRRFARRLYRFEEARCSYILRAMLSGPGFVRETADGFEATLPRSPLRVVLDRADVLGEIRTPWRGPTLRLVKGDQ